MDILGEMEEGKNAHEFVRKAQNMLLLKSLKEVENCCRPCTSANENEEEEKMLITNVWRNKC